MQIYDIVLIALGLSMDALAVSVCKGLAAPKLPYKNALIIGLYFGIFQGVMPIIGYYLGLGFYQFIETFDHWIAFALLAIIGVKMIWDAAKEYKELKAGSALTPAEEERRRSVAFRVMLPLSVATSIDALVTGVTFAMAGASIWIAVGIIAGTTFVLCAAGAKAASVFRGFFNARFQTVITVAGGAVLILMGIKILLEHLGVFGI